MLSLKKESFLNFKSLRNTHIIQKARNAVYDNLISLLDHTSPPKNLAIQAQAVCKQVNAKSHAKKLQRLNICQKPCTCKTTMPGSRVLR